jgi:hypothetical protein
MLQNGSHAPVQYASTSADGAPVSSCIPSDAERERLHLRQELYFGRRAFKLNPTLATHESIQWLNGQVKKALHNLRMKWDPAYFLSETGRRPWTRKIRWETLKKGYDAQNPRTVLAHVLCCWDYWLTVTHKPKKCDRRYAMALILARRVLRGWRLWTVREQLLAPTWQQIRLNARLLPPLPTPPTPTRPRTSPTTSESHADYYYGRSPWRSHLSGHWGNAESVELTSNYDQWRSAQDSLLQDFDRLHPGRVWLRSWHTVDSPISRSHCPTVLWYDFSPSRSTTPPFGQMLMRDRYSRPPIKLRYVICHYGQPFSWHWIEAAPTSGPTHYFQPHGPATEWQETVLFTTVGSSPGPSAAAVHSFNTSPTHPKPFTTMVSVTHAAGESAEYYSSKEVEVADFPGAEELTSCTQSSVESALEPEVCPPLLACTQESILPQTQYFAVPDDLYSSEADEAEEFSVSEGVVARLSHREWRVLRHAMYRWQDLTFEPHLFPKLSVGPLCFDVDWDTDDSGEDSPHPSTQDSQLSSASDFDNSFIGEGSEWYEDSEMLCPDFSDDIFENDYDEHILDWPDYLAREAFRDTLPSHCARRPWRTDCTVSVDEADMADTWELPPLTASDCAGELDMIRYTISLSKMRFEEDAAAAVLSERCASLAGQLDRARFASQMTAVKDYWDNRRSSLRRRHTSKESPAKCPTKRGRRQHQRDLRKARAHRRTDRTGVSRPAQPVAQPRPAFSFAPPTAPTIPQAATRGVFVFGDTARANLSTHGSANLSDALRAPGRDTGAKPVLTASPVDPKSHPARCKQSGVILSSGALLPDKVSDPPCQVEDSQADDSEQASDASTVPMLVTLLSLICGFGPALPRRRRKTRVCRSSWLVPQSFVIDTDLGKHCQDLRRHLPRCTRALMRALGRSRWLNGLCRGLHRGCTDGTGPRPSVEP